MKTMRRITRLTSAGLIPLPRFKTGIDFINKVLAKGKPYCDPDFTPNLVPSYIREDEMDKMRNDALPKD
jgi:hypothetical protein